MFNLKGPQGQNPRTTCGLRTTVWETLTYTIPGASKPLNPRSRVFLENLTFPQLVRNFCPSPHSHEPATCPYPEPVQSSPHSSIPFFNIRFNIILASTPMSYEQSHSYRFRPNPVYQCFSNCVRPRSGKFFFITRGPGSNKFTRKYLPKFF